MMTESNRATFTGTLDATVDTASIACTAAAFTISRPPVDPALRLEEIVGALLPALGTPAQIERAIEMLDQVAVSAATPIERTTAGALATGMRAELRQLQRSAWRF